jgi:alpha-1,6-mannosyltransferase
MCAAMCRLSWALKRLLGAPTAVFFTVLTACQFHLPFYASRTLPNTTALVLAVLAIAHWVDDTEPWLTMALLLLFSRRMRLWHIASVGLAAAALSLVATVLVDSWFWGRWLWPEGEVFWFNTVLGRCASSGPHDCCYCC